jgi:hypothetical protein
MREFDVVHSSGVLYHLPSPLEYISRLRAITREFCILTSTTIPNTIVVDREHLDIPNGATLFVPSLAGKELKIIVEWFKRRGRENIAEPVNRFGGYRNLYNYYPNWFIPTVPAFRSMAECCGFEIVNEAEIEPESLSYCLLLRPKQ